MKAYKNFHVLCVCHPRHPLLLPSFSLHGHSNISSSTEGSLTSYISHHNSTVCLSLIVLPSTPSSLLFGELLPCKANPVSESHCRRMGGRKPKNYLRKRAGILLLGLLQIHKGCKATKSEERKHSKGRFFCVTLHIKRVKKREIATPWWRISRQCYEQCLHSSTKPFHWWNFSAYTLLFTWPYLRL